MARPLSLDYKRDHQNLMRLRQRLAGDLSSNVHVVGNALTLTRDLIAKVELLIDQEKTSEEAVKENGKAEIIQEGPFTFPDEIPTKPGARRT